MQENISEQEIWQEEPWPELVDRPPPPFPVELLPGHCSQLCTALAASLPVPEDFIACALLGVASAALVGRVVVNPRKGYYEAIQLYLCMCAESGTRKTAALDLISGLRTWLGEHNGDIRQQNRLRTDQREVLENRLGMMKRKGGPPAEMASLRRQIDDLADLPSYEVVLTDTTPEALASRMYKQRGRAIIHTDEGQFINVLAGASYGKQGGVANLDTVLKGYDNAACFIDRKQDGAVEISRASLAMTLGLQPSMVQRMASNNDLGDRGFVPRMLFFVPDTARHIDVKHLPPYPKSLVDEWNQLVLRLASLNREQEEPLMLPMTAEARAVFEDYWQSMNDRLFTDLGYAEIRPWVQKAHGKAARLSGILTLLDDPDAKIIEAGAVRAAVAMMDGYFLPHAQAILGGPNELSDEAQCILNAIKDKEYFRTAEVYHDLSGQKRFRGKEGREAYGWALAELLKANYIRIAYENAPQGRGRPASTRYAVHPALRHPEGVRPLQEGIL